MLIINDSVPRYDLTEIKRGTLIWAKHRSWAEPVTGFVMYAGDDDVIVQYPPTLRNVTNHFHIPAKEAGSKEWEIRYTNDMETITKYPEESEDDSEGTDSTATA